MLPVRIANRLVGPDQPVFIVAELGINHNGDLDHAMRLINIARMAGCNAVKFQKRTVDVVYSAEELAKPRESPFGHTNGDLKRGLELSRWRYNQIDHYCKEIGIMWFASPWDEPSVDFLSEFDIPCYKIASASLTDDNLLRHIRQTGKPIILSTGMSTWEQVDHAVEVLDTHDLILMHTTSIYPANPDELNLRCITTMSYRYEVPVGYSGHELGTAMSVCAAALGACMIERHITTDAKLWGSDQASSLEPSGLLRLVHEIREWEEAKGDGVKRVYERELPVIQKLRRVGA